MTLYHSDSFLACSITKDMWRTPNSIVKLIHKIMLQTPEQIAARLSFRNTQAAEASESSSPEELPCRIVFAASSPESQPMETRSPAAQSHNIEQRELPTIVERELPKSDETLAGPSTSPQAAPPPVVTVKQPEIALATSEVVSFRDDCNPDRIIIFSIPAWDAVYTYLT